MPFFRSLNASKNVTLYRDVDAVSLPYKDHFATTDLGRPHVLRLAASTVDGTDVNFNCTLYGSSTRDARIDFVPLRDLPSPGALVLTIPRKSGLTAPRRGLRPSDPLAVSGNAPGFEFGHAVPETPCAGLCATSYAWSATRGNETLASTLKFTYVGSVEKGDALRLTLPGFKREADLVVKLGDSATLVQVQSWSYDDVLTLVFTAAVSLTDAGTTLQLTGFRGPTLGIVQNQRNFTLQYNISAITEDWSEARAVETVPSMAKAAVVTNLRMASLNASSTKQYLGFRYGRPLSSGETVTIVFSGGFTGKPFIGENTTEVVRQGGPDPYNFKVESWDQETETLVIRCNQDIPEEENVYVNITNLNAPSTGVLPRLRQGITLSTDEDFGTLAFRGVKVGRPILVASQAAVTWVEDELGQHEERRDVGRPGERVVADLSVRIDGADLRHGDTMAWYLPKLHVPDCWADVCGLYVNATSARVNVTAKYDLTTEIVTLNILGNITAGAHRTFRVGRVAVDRNLTDTIIPGVRNRTLALPSDGWPSSRAAHVTISSGDDSWDTIEQLPVTVPCAGLCASALSFEEPKAGAPTSVAIQWSTSFAPNSGTRSASPSIVVLTPTAAF